MSRSLFLRDSVVRKNLMALTGLFLCLFLVIHLAGNLQLLLPAEQAQVQYNHYSALLSHNLFIKVVSYALYASIVAHAAYALVLTIRARQARGPQGYAYDKRGKVTPWYVRNMGVLGTLLLAFIIIHMRDFWYPYKFTEMPLDPEGRKDLYTIVAASFQQLWYVVLYVVSMLALGFHLLHGFHSAFQTLGLYHSKYNRWIKWVGYGYTFIMTAGFTLIPIYMYIIQNKPLP